MAALAVATYEHPEVFTGSTANSPTIADCDGLPFGPGLSTGLTSAEANAPTGLNLDMQLPASEGVKVREPAELRDLDVELPPGLIVDPEVAEERPTCTYEQFGFGVDGPDKCPAGSAVGTFSVTIGEFEPTLEGTAYLGVTEPETYRLLLTASGPIGTIKLIAKLEQDLDEEQVTAVFYELPQIPLRTLGLDLDPDAELLLTPPACDEYTAVGEMTPWSGGPSLVALNTLAIDEGCTHEEPSIPTTESSTNEPSLVFSGNTGSSPRTAQPLVRLTKRPGRRTRDRTPTFRFKSNIPGSTFRCRIDGRSFHRCTSPTTLGRLAYGPHTFRVQAVDRSGQASAPTIWRFHVRRR